MHKHPSRDRIAMIRRRLELRRLIAVRARRAFTHLGYFFSDAARVAILSAAFALVHVAEILFEFEKTFAEKKERPKVEGEVVCIQHARS